jgi:hypothetical protein
MHLFFIRHGQSANNHLWEQTGSNRGRSEDPELTETGPAARLLWLYAPVYQPDGSLRADGHTAGGSNRRAAEGLGGYSRDGRDLPG